MHSARRIPLRHLLVNDATASGHPLDISRGDNPAIAHAVAMLDGSSQNVSDGFNAAMRVPWETGEIVLGNVIV
jgi:hypothetical protein